MKQKRSERTFWDGGRSDLPLRTAQCMAHTQSDMHQPPAEHYADSSSPSAGRHKSHLSPTPQFCCQMSDATVPCSGPVLPSSTMYTINLLSFLTNEAWHKVPYGIAANPTIP